MFLFWWSIGTARQTPNTKYFIKKPLIRQFPFTLQHSDHIFYVTPTKISNIRPNNEISICFCGSYGDGMRFRVTRQTDQRLYHKTATGGLFESRFRFQLNEGLWVSSVTNLKLYLMTVDSNYSVEAHENRGHDTNHRHTLLVKTAPKQGKWINFSVLRSIGWRSDADFFSRPSQNRHINCIASAKPVVSNVLLSLSTSSSTVDLSKNNHVISRRCLMPHFPEFPMNFTAFIGMTESARLARGEGQEVIVAACNFLVDQQRPLKHVYWIVLWFACYISSLG